MIETSKYLQVNDYLLLEYFYKNEERDTSSTNALRIENNISNEFQFVNDAGSSETTGNILDYSASEYDKSQHKWALHDIDRTNLINTDSYTLSEVTNVIKIDYDRIRVHILSGFTFTGLDGFIIDLYFNERKLDTKSHASTYAYLKGNLDQIHFNSKPFFVGERSYDRYVEFDVPSFYSIQNNYKQVVNESIGMHVPTYAYNYSHPVQNNPYPGGFIMDSQVMVDVYEILRTEDATESAFLYTGDATTLSINPIDDYFSLGAYLAEVKNQDYFEYFATWGGEMIEDYISELNSSTSGDWAIINQIDVYEQVGANIIHSSNFTSMQNSLFDSPNNYRPILLHADTAYSFYIDYTARLYNKLSGEQIVRTSSVASNNPKKYGKSLTKINVSEGFRPIKVYNRKVVSSPSTINVTDPRVITKIVRSYVSTNTISVTQSNDSGIGSDIFMPGEESFMMTPFANSIRFKIVKYKEGSDPVAVDLSSSNIVLGFDDARFEINKSADININANNGEVLFIIDEATSKQLRKITSNRFYILAVDKFTSEKTVLYQGIFAIDPPTPEVIPPAPDPSPAPTPDSTPDLHVDRIHGGPRPIEDLDHKNVNTSPRDHMPPNPSNGSFAKKTPESAKKITTKVNKPVETTTPAKATTVPSTTTKKKTSHSYKFVKPPR